MKKQIAPTAVTPIVRGTFYLLLLLTFCIISFALAERNGSTRAQTQMHLRGRNPHVISGTVSEAWVARYNRPANNYDGAVGIVCDGSGNVYVTGESVGVETGADYLTIKYNSSGAESGSLDTMEASEMQLQLWPLTVQATSTLQARAGVPKLRNTIMPRSSTMQ